MTQSNLQGEFQKVIEETMDGQDLLRMEIRGRMVLMAKLGRELISNDIDGFFVAAIITATDYAFPANIIHGDDHKEEIRKHLIALAKRANALCLIVVMQGWSVKNTAENFQPNLPPSLHPARAEALVIDAKDYFEHLTGMQFIRRSEEKVEFDELQIGSCSKSWLDDWQVIVPAETLC